MRRRNARLIHGAHILAREPFRAAALRLMPFAEEAAHPIVDVVVDGLVHRYEGAMREVRRPTAQETVQSSLHFRPGALRHSCCAASASR